MASKCEDGRGEQSMEERMGTEIRKPGGAIQWTHAAPFAEANGDGTATAAVDDAGSDSGHAPLTQLVGAMFTTPKELRHLAERELGELFVPVEVLAESAHTAVYTLHPGSLAPLLVHAERARHWFPFRVTRVEAARNPGRAGADGSTVDVPPAPRPPVRPAIDWL
jgi:hypothetical protein